MTQNDPPDNNTYQDPYDEERGYSEDFETLQVDNEASKVATARKRGLLLLSVLLIAGMYFVYTKLIDPQPAPPPVDPNLVKPEKPVDIKNIEETKPQTGGQGVISTEEIENLPQPPQPKILGSEVGGNTADFSTEIEVPSPPELPNANRVGNFPLPQGNSQQSFNQNSATSEIPEIIIFNESGDPLPPPSLNTTPALGTGTTNQLTEQQQQEINKRSINNFITGGTPSGEVSLIPDNVTLFSYQNPETPENNSPPGATATRIEDLYRTIAQGKMIEAVLETVINTDIAGKLRAVVTRDVYSEQGTNVLLPRGARLIGTYSNNVVRNQARIRVTWTRAIRPDGVDIEINSQATDRLGRAGLAGDIDNKYMELFGSSLVFSSLTTGVALISEQFTDGDGVNTTVTDGGTTQTGGSPGDLAVADMVSNLGSVATGLSSELLETQPTFTVDQGAVMKIYVDKDLYFPTIYR